MVVETIDCWKGEVVVERISLETLQMKLAF